MYLNWSNKTSCFSKWKLNHSLPYDFISFTCLCTYASVQCGHCIFRFTPRRTYSISFVEHVENFNITAGEKKWETAQTMTSKNPTGGEGSFFVYFRGKPPSRTDVSPRLLHENTRQDITTMNFECCLSLSSPLLARFMLLRWNRKDAFRWKRFPKEVIKGSLTIMVLMLEGNCSRKGDFDRTILHSPKK